MFLASTGWPLRNPEGGLLSLASVSHLTFSSSVSSILKTLGTDGCVILLPQY